LSLLIPDPTHLSQWAQNTPSAANQLAQAFWPGPLTLILPPAQHVLPLLSPHQKGIGLRVPNHPIAQRLLKAFGHALAAPSANISGQLSPTCAEHVSQQLAQQINFILDG